MPLVYKDRVQETTTTTGTGTLTLAGAVTGFQSFAEVGDGNTCIYTITDANGSAWEVGIGTYTASGTTLARTTVLASSNSGSAINLSAGTHKVFLSAGAAELNKATLPIVTQAVTTANVTAAVNAHYVCTIAGLTANRNFVLPSPTAVGDRVQVTVTDGDADYALIVIGNTGVTINGGSAATEWSRLINANESVEFVATSSSNWQVSNDRRVPCSMRMELTTDADGETAFVWSVPTSLGGAWTTISATGITTDTANSRATIRRAGKYICTMNGRTKDAMADGNDLSIRLYDGANVIARSGAYAAAAGNSLQLVAVSLADLSVSDVIQYQFQTSSGGLGMRGAAGITLFTFAEQL